MAGLLAITMPMPKIRAKIITGRIWFSAAAVKTLDGIISRKNCPASMLFGALPTIADAPAAPLGQQLLGQNRIRPRHPGGNS